MKLEKYRDPWLAEKVNEFVGFYTREFSCLDNLSAFAINFDGKCFATVEHAYQAMKFKNTAPDVAEEIRNCSSAVAAKKIAHANLDKVDSRFDIEKVEIMEKLLRAKLNQHPFVQKKLLETGNAMICEDSPEDEFWGIGINRDGQNHMGRIWMKLREELQGRVNGGQ